MVALLDNLETSGAARAFRPEADLRRRRRGPEGHDRRAALSDPASGRGLRRRGRRPPVIPDVYVREDAHGLWRVELNSDTLPRILVDQRYHATVSKGARNDSEKTFVSECFAQANWLPVRKAWISASAPAPS